MTYLCSVDEQIFVYKPGATNGYVLNRLICHCNSLSLRGFSNSYEHLVISRVERALDNPFYIRKNQKAMDR
jgi:predicted nucleic acid-binding Zn finger protein